MNIRYQKQYKMRHVILFQLVVVFLVVVDAASVTSDDDMPHSDASMTGSIFKLVKSGVVPIDGGRMAWEGGHVMPGVEDELKWGSPFEDPSVDEGYGWGGEIIITANIHSRLQVIK